MVDKIVNPDTSGQLPYPTVPTEPSEPVEPPEEPCTNLVPEGSIYVDSVFTLTGLTIGLNYTVSFGINDASMINPFADPLLIMNPGNSDPIAFIANRDFVVFDCTGFLGNIVTAKVCAV